MLDDPGNAATNAASAAASGAESVCSIRPVGPPSVDIDDKQALRLNNEVPGIVIPEAMLKEMEKAGDGARDRGFALARRMLDWARTARADGIAGAYLIPPFKRYEEIMELFR